MLGAARWRTGLALALLSLGLGWSTAPGLAAGEGRVLRVVGLGGNASQVVPPANSTAQEPVGVSFIHLAARAAGAPVAQVTPTPGPDGGVRVILAPDARGPLPPAITVPPGQLPASFAAATVSLTPVPMASTGTGPATAALLTTNAASSAGGAATGAPGGSSPGGIARLIPNLPATPNGARIVSLAQTQVGARYTWGGTSPSTGFDCSGFVYWVFNTLGYPLERTLPEQFSAGRRVRLEELRPGDIVFFADTYTSGLSHNGIYIGDGKFIHAVDESTGVAITPLNSAYWEQRYVGAVRVVD